MYSCEYPVECLCFVLYSMYWHVITNGHIMSHMSHLFFLGIFNSVCGMFSVSSLKPKTMENVWEDEHMCLSLQIKRGKNGWRQKTKWGYFCVLLLHFWGTAVKKDKSTDEEKSAAVAFKWTVDWWTESAKKWGWTGCGSWSGGVDVGQQCFFGKIWSARKHCC